MRWLALLTAFAVLQPIQAGTRASAQDAPAAAPPAPSVAVDAPLSFDEWLAALTDEARAKGFSDGLIEETLAGCQAARAGHPERPQPGRAQSRLQPIRRRTPDAGHDQSRQGTARPPQDAARARRERVRRAAALPGGLLGVGVALRSHSGLDARLPGARHPGLGAAPRHAIPRRALQRLDDGAAGTYRSRGR